MAKKEENIDASPVNFIDFLSDNESNFYFSKLRIPAFQRNYSWDNKHIKDLINSIEKSEKNYYIGNILIQGNSGRDLVIDGQQRITTILLILRALKDSGLSRKNQKKLEEIFFQNKDKEILRLEFVRDNLNHSFKKIIIENDLEISNFKDDNSKKFLNNFNFIKKEINNLGDINLFFEKIITLTFIVIKFNDKFDVNQLFEGLNSKGKILSAVQLTKNALIGSAKNSIYNKEIIETWEDVEKNFEQNKVIWFDKYLRHLGFYKYNYISSSDLFKKLKEDFNKQAEEELLEFTKSFREDAVLYLKIRTGELLKKDISTTLSESDWNIIISLIKNLSYADLDQVYSVIFATIKFSKSNPSYIKGKNSKLLLDIKRIWSFSILAKYLDTKPSLFERYFANYSNSLSKNSLNERDSFFNKIKSIVKDSNKNKFCENLNSRIRITGESNLKINSKNNRNYTSQLLLLYLENGKRFVIEDFTLEHIIPKGKKDGLKNWKAIDKKYIKEVRDISRYKLGNLTLLSEDKLGNESFDDKLEYYLVDKFKLNKGIKKYKGLFNSENPTSAVKQRGEDVAEDIYKILLSIILN